MTNLLKGKPVVEKIELEIRNLIANNELNPKLAIVLGSADPASKSYVNSLQKNAERLSIATEIIEFDKQITQSDASEEIKKLSKRPDVSGIIIQSPINNLDINYLRLFIDSPKDVDCSSEFTLGRLFLGIQEYSPATAQAVVEILKHNEIILSGKHVVIIGRSTVVGKPLAHLMLQENATVTICHSKTKNIADFAKNADVLVSAAGQANLVNADMINQNMIVVDVGTNYENGKLKGDVDFENVAENVKAITPVPGGVGPVTTAILLRNTCWSAQKALLNKLQKCQIILILTKPLQ